MALRDDLMPFPDAEFAFDVAPVREDRGDGYAQFVGDLPRRAVPHAERDDALLGRGQVDGGAMGGFRGFRYVWECAVLRIVLSLGDCGDGVDQRGTERAFVEQGLRPGVGGTCL